MGELSLSGANIRSYPSRNTPPSITRLLRSWPTRYHWSLNVLGECQMTVGEKAIGPLFFRICVQ